MTEEKPFKRLSTPSDFAREICMHADGLRLQGIKGEIDINKVRDMRGLILALEARLDLLDTKDHRTMPSSRRGMRGRVPTEEEMMSAIREFIAQRGFFPTVKASPAPLRELIIKNGGFKKWRARMGYHGPKKWSQCKYDNAIVKMARKHCRVPQLQDFTDVHLRFEIRRRGGIKKTTSRLSERIRHAIARDATTMILEWVESNGRIPKLKDITDERAKRSIKGAGGFYSVLDKCRKKADAIVAKRLEELYSASVQDALNQ